MPPSWPLEMPLRVPPSWPLGMPPPGPLRVPPSGPLPVSPPRPLPVPPPWPLGVPPPQPHHIPSSEGLPSSTLLSLGLCLLGYSGRTSLLCRVSPSPLRWPPWYGVLTRLRNGTRAPRVLPPPSGTSRRMEIRHIHHRLTEVPFVDMLIEAWNGSIYRWHGVSLWCGFLRIPQLHAPPVPGIRQSSSE